MGLLGVRQKRLGNTKLQNIAKHVNAEHLANTESEHQINAICREGASGVRQNNKTIPAVHNNCYSLGGREMGGGRRRGVQMMPIRPLAPSFFPLLSSLPVSSTFVVFLM